MEPSNYNEIKHMKTTTYNPEKIEQRSWESSRLRAKPARLSQKHARLSQKIIQKTGPY